MISYGSMGYVWREKELDDIGRLEEGYKRGTELFGRLISTKASVLGVYSVDLRGAMDVHPGELPWESENFAAAVVDGRLDAARNSMPVQGVESMDQEAEISLYENSDWRPIITAIIRTSRRV